MIYRLPAPDELLDQGDIIQGCPLVVVEGYDPDQPERLPVVGAPSRVIILTQACDLANQKAKSVVVAAVLDAQALVTQGLLKAADVKRVAANGRQGVPRFSTTLADGAFRGKLAFSGKSLLLCRVE